MAERTTRILLVDDEQSILTLLSYPLRQDGYEVVRASSGAEALERFAELEFDLVVLDVMMPAMDGLEVCRRMRSSSTVPIIMLTAKTEEIDKVLGLELGADDYITKPFSIRELSQPRGRRRCGHASAMRPVSSAGDGDDDHEPIEAGELRVDFEKRAVRMHGDSVPTTFVEFEILALLARHPGRVFSREALLERIWGDSAYRDPRTIDVHIRHLREKLEQDAKEPEYIFTVRGVGYRFRDNDGRRIPWRPTREGRTVSAQAASRRPTILRSIRTRLAAIFFLITLLAVAVMYVVIATPLNSALQTQRINDLRTFATRYASEKTEHWRTLRYNDPEKALTEKDATHIATAAAIGTQSDVTLFDVLVGTTGTLPPQARKVGSSPGAPPAEDLAPIAIDAASSGGKAQGTVASAQGPVGAVGFVVATITKDSGVSRVAVFSVPLRDLVPVTSLVRSRLLVAAAIALAVALLTGVLVARALTVRVLRLESTAQRVAAGDFDAHFSDSSGDELRAEAGRRARPHAEPARGSRGSRAGVSSRPPRTSCARRSSRSAASSS